MKYLSLIHAYIVQIILNLIPFFWMDVFYDNMTHIGNALHHPIYLLLWASSTAAGLYTYSILIWNHYKIEYNKSLHFLICAGWILSCSIPYNDALPFWINDAHVWIAITSTVGFGLEWIYLYTKKESFIYSEIKTLLFVLQCVFAICFIALCLASHVNGFCEILFSVLVNIILVNFLFRHVF